MKDLMQSQIKDHCKINMPDGLKELMCDISREVLRAQPSNIYQFIADYLSAMLVTRDHLFISAQVCSNICDSDCKATLVSELQQIGLEEADVEVTSDVIMKYLNKGKVNECNLISVLTKKTEIDPSKFPEILNAVRTAYLHQQAFNVNEFETASMSGDEVIKKARAHTLNLYQQSKPTQEMYHAAANKIKFSYRAYGVRRSVKTNKYYTIPPARNNSLDNVQVDDIGMHSIDSLSEDLKNELELTNIGLRNRMSTVSSLSLAGSYCCLPKQKPYNANDDLEYLSELEESSEKQHSNYDYSTGILEISTDETNVNYENIKKEISDQDIDKKEGEKSFDDNDGELIDELVTIVSDKSDEVIGESLHEGSEVSINLVPDEELTIDGCDYDDDYVINDDNDDLNNHSDSQSNDVMTEVVISSNLYDSKEPTSFAKS